MEKSDPELVSWERYFQPSILPQQRMLATLIEAASRLDAASGYLHGLSESAPQVVARGLAVARMAYRYADAVLEQFGLWDGATPPPPSDLGQARRAVDNLLGYVREQVALGRMALGPVGDLDQEHTDYEPADGGETCAAANGPDSNKLVIERETFSVHWRGRTLKLGNTIPFALLARLAQRPGSYLEVKVLIDEVWRDEETEKNTVQRTVSNLRTMLREAGMGDLVIDGDNKDHYALILP